LTAGCFAKNSSILSDVSTRATAFAERAGIAVRYECTWQSTAKVDGPDGTTFVLQTSDGEYRTRLLVLAVGPASAVCRCICLNGNVRTQCSGELDPPAIYSRICPMPARPLGSPPEISGMATPLGAEGTLGTGSPALLGATGNR
jgi:hypothetical protein